jgi:hypothetical protein
MKRFLLFECPHYYPHGGSGDVIAECDTLEECKEYITDELQYNNRYEILDLEERKWIPC